MVLPDKSVSWEISYKTYGTAERIKMKDLNKHKEAKKRKCKNNKKLLLGYCKIFCSASREVGVVHGAISNCLLGNSRIAGGYQWKYKK